MQAFEQLGRQVEQQWAQSQYDERAFPDIATEALQRFSTTTDVDPMDVLRWAAMGELPEQPNIGAKFGEPPTTVFHRSRFYIEVLFWLDGTTSIHQHRFSGAFYVLRGASVHTRRHFETTQVVNGHFRLGNLTLQAAELLEKGAIRPIVSGAPLIHSLFHLDRPSVTVVVRTARDVYASPQFKFLPPHVAADSHYAETGNTRRLQVLTSLAKLGLDPYAALVSDLVKTLDLQSLFYVLLHANEHLGARPEFDALLEEVQRRHGGCAEQFRQVFLEERRQRTLVSQRKLVNGTDERFFIALALNLPSRKELLGLLARRWPDAPAVERALQLFERVTSPEADPKLADRVALDWSGQTRGLVRTLLEGKDASVFFKDLAGRPEVSGAELERLRTLEQTLVRTHPYRVLFSGP